MTVWHLTDYLNRVATSPDSQDPIGGSWPCEKIVSETQLRELLSYYHNRYPPSRISLICNGYEGLAIMIGPQLSALHWVRGSWDQNLKKAIHASPLSEEGAGFYYLGLEDGWWCPAEELFPTDQVIAAVLEYYRTLRLPETLHWRTEIERRPENTLYDDLPF